MVVTKILETTLAAGVTSVQFTDSDIPNSLIRVFCNDADLIYTSLSLTGNTLTVTYPAQNVNKYIALELVKAGLDIVDNLSTDDATKALSAKQGKALDDKIDALDLEDLYNVSVTAATNGDVLIYYGGEWINVPGKNNITDMDDVAVSTIQDGQFLAWDAIEEKFVNVPSPASSITYSTTEQLIGKWIDNSNLYEKTVDLGALPNASSKTVSHGISNLNKVISMSGICNNRNNAGYARPLPFSDPSTPNIIRIDMGGGNIGISTQADWSSYDGYVTIRYTKSS